MTPRAIAAFKGGRLQCNRITWNKTASFDRGRSLAGHALAELILLLYKTSTEHSRDSLIDGR